MFLRIDCWWIESGGGLEPPFGCSAITNNGHTTINLCSTYLMFSFIWGVKYRSGRIAYTI
jgi:hypothetical protein